MPLLRAEDLTVDFGTQRALGALSFAIEAGERVAFVGESGAGKSLLGLSLVNLLPREARRGGAVSLDDKPLPKAESQFAPLRGRRLGIAFQDAEGALDPLRRVTSELRAAARRARDAVPGGVFDQLLDDLGLNRKRLAGFPDELTSAERQLALLAAALLPGPDLLIADEPGAALDPIGRRRVLDQLAAISDRRKMAVVLLTRDPRVAALLAKQVFVLRDGRVSDSGSTEAVLVKPRDEYTRSLVATGKPRSRSLMRSPIGADLLDVHHVGRTFRRGLIGFRSKPPAALADIAFTIKSAEAVAVVGPAGSGKSTLARIIAGIERADTGDVVFERLTYRGRDLPRAFRSEIGLVSGSPRDSFDVRHTVFEAIGEPLHLLRMVDAPARPGRIAGMAELAGLRRDMLGMPARALSPPDLVRLALARALVMRPRLLLLDEPVAMIDLRPRGELLSLIGRLRADLGITLLIFTRDVETVRSFADRILVLDQGRIVETGRPAELFQAQQHKATEALFRARLPDLV